MNTFAMRQRIKVDSNHTIHVTLPMEMGDDVEVIIVPLGKGDVSIPQESLAMAILMDETGFAKHVLNSPEEDCWNEL